MYKHTIIVAALILVGVGTHLLPHPFGFTTVGALSLLAAAYLPRHLVPIPILVTVLASDFMIGGYALVSMIIVYSSHIVAAVSVQFLCRTEKVMSLAAAGVLNAVIFYLLSNLSPMAAGYYPPTMEGLITCYIMALPFLLKGIAANLIFGALAFGSVFAVRTLAARLNSSATAGE